MEKLTQEQALKEVFSKSLSSKMTVYKHRHSNGKLSQKAIEDILEAHDFIITQEKLYSKK